MKYLTMKNALLILFLVCLSFNVKSQVPPTSYNCPGNDIQKNKIYLTNASKKEVLISIQWVEVLESTKQLTLITSSLGKDLAIIKTQGTKLSFEKYIRQVDSTVTELKKKKVITETQNLIETWYCYLKDSRKKISDMNYLIEVNDVKAGIEKITAYINRSKKEDNARIHEVDNILNTMAERYDLYKYR